MARRKIGPVLRLGKRGFVADAADLERARREFEARAFVHLPGLLDPSLLSWLLRAVASGTWEEHDRPEFDFEYVLEDGAAMRALHVLANGRAFLDAVHRMTGAGPFSWFGGRVYRLAPRAGHYDSWHTDNSDGRLIAMSINVSARAYEGGMFQMRRRSSDRLLVEFANTIPGDATLFRIDKDLVHRVSGVTGPEPKTAFAGWFVASEPSLADRLRDRRDRGAEVPDLR